ncbi:hypothetical protein ACEWY4_005678 [Coilia grayii]|uniref:C2 domain-containing protein n=1 Tax=Coilia grayii TaxID=363190 RepID=A0ABD1KJY3_9TELE
MLITDKVIQGNVIAAIQKHLRENAVSSPFDGLGCESGNCCPKEPRKATLRINSIRATGLRGDWWGHTEAFAKVNYGAHTKETNQVHSNNSVWNGLDFGNVYTIAGSSLRVDVYDEDWWRDQHLGSCSINLAVGSCTKTCSFGRSTATVSYTLTCAAHLTGDLCEEYTPRSA